MWLKMFYVVKSGCMYRLENKYGILVVIVKIELFA